MHEENKYEYYFVYLSFTHLILKGLNNLIITLWAAATEQQLIQTDITSQKPLKN